LEPRDSRRTVAETFAPLTVGEPTLGLSPPIIRTSSNVTLSFSALPRTSRSTKRVSPSATRYCFPPERMMANTTPSETRMVTGKPRSEEGLFRLFERGFHQESVPDLRLFEPRGLCLNCEQLR